MGPPPLLRLPPELRNYICELALRQPDPIIIRPRTVKHWLWPARTALTSHSTNPHPTTLTTTCKSARNYCTQLFHAANIFLFTCAETYQHPENCDAMPHLTQTFLHQIGPLNRLALHSLRFEVGATSFSVLTDTSPTSELSQLADLAGFETQIKEVRCAVVVWMAEAGPTGQRWNLTNMHVRKLAHSLGKLEKATRRLRAQRSGNRVAVRWLEWDLETAREVWEVHERAVAGQGAGGGRRTWSPVSGWGERSGSAPARLRGLEVEVGDGIGAALEGLEFSEEDNEKVEEENGDKEGDKSSGERSAPEKGAGGAADGCPEPQAAGEEEGWTSVRQERADTVLEEGFVLTWNEDAAIQPSTPRSLRCEIPMGLDDERKDVLCWTTCRDRSELRRDHEEEHGYTEN
ncbi:hypothetical protein B0A55_00172 [Friedmanniomyces simplex]|uniref:2EXR domain-containing protein n=1 Tax=Friedmanniomyces simplex TaxID=329884 RepID=A0A4U0Y7X4_9PEZI|nr:hypothetical protein B0A55_00172 [Friedmanniomyces simplex]